MSYDHEYGSFPKSFKMKGTLCSRVKTLSTPDPFKVQKRVFNIRANCSRK